MWPDAAADDGTDLESLIRDSSACRDRIVDGLRESPFDVPFRTRVRARESRVDPQIYLNTLFI
ncbi:hypothetical protein NJ7G_4255 [Natrinema sp. J7-2]|nr:hypothetical protein NJ7G_4255 [Natrinema sp. J7-2]